MRSLFLTWVWISLLSGVYGQGLIVVDDPVAANQPGQIMPFPPRPPHRPMQRHTPLEIRSLRADVRIDDQVARTIIQQEFYNPNPTRLEGTFLLPLPKGAHLDNFRLEVNGKMTDAELLTADKARGIYQEIVRQAMDPALLEYVGRDLVKVRIFPIEPNSTKRIDLKYSQVLTREGGLTEYILPLNSAKHSAAPIQNLSVTLDLVSRSPLKTLYSPSHAIDATRHADKSATATFKANGYRPDRDFQFLFSAETDGIGLSLLGYKKPGEDGYFMLVASPGIDHAEDRIAPKDVVFVIDTSGSMSGNKLEQAQAALKFCIGNLNARDRFEIVRFSTETQTLFRELALADRTNRKKAVEFVDDLKVTGGTAIDAALQSALDLRPEKSDRPFLVVFLTDGQPTVGERDPSRILFNVQRKSGGLTRIFCFGLGTDVNTHLLDTLAERTLAVSQYVLPSEDIEVKVSNFFRKVSDPILAGVQLDFGRLDINKLHPGKIPDLFKGQQLIAFGRYPTGGKGTLTLRGKVGATDKVFEYPVALPNHDTTRDFIPRLWATRRVGFLLDEIRLHGQQKELEEEVTELARKYGIVTPFTSFLVQEDQPILATGAQSSHGTVVSSPSTSPTSNDPLAFYRKNPELMKRYFPMMYAQMYGGKDPSQSGEQAVHDSKYLSELKSADAVQSFGFNGQPPAKERRQDGGLIRDIPARDAGSPSVMHMMRYGNRPAAPAGQAAEADTRAITEFRGGRTFHRTGEVWTDLGILALSNPKVIQLKFNSKEYYDLAQRHPEVLAWYALGQRVKFLLDGKVYEVVTE